ncbi:MAG TPA: carbohydrate binding domain-containing protein, partial [Pyrinomonadaceae bacterium]|nr:carbohydrate binding domain-containing protein [Pyrinomonadaceae bacterium]
MKDDLVIRPGVKAVRVVACSVALVAVAVVFFAVKWQVGDMLARLTNVSDENAVAIADTAVAFAPRDPNASALRAEIGTDPLSEDTRTAVEIAEQTVRLAPNDHRWHIALARALADDGQVERAESEFKRSIDLAPSYAVCRWYYGNFLLRLDRREEATTQFKVAAADNWEYRQQVFSLLWDIGGKDAHLIESVAGDDVHNTAHLALFLASRRDASDALRIWMRLPNEARAMYNGLADAMAVGLFEQKHFPEALEFSREVGRDPDAKFETVTNGSFEGSFEPSAENSQFSWHIARGEPNIDIAVDYRVAHDGQRSLRLNFKGFAKAEFSNIEQSLAVTPNTHYRLSVWVRTENLKAVAGPQVDILNANLFASLGRTSVIPNGTNGWQQLTVEFTTPPGCDGIIVRTVRG